MSGMQRTITDFGAAVQGLIEQARWDMGISDVRMAEILRGKAAELETRKGTAR